jgi:hypothetical protein
MGLGLRAYVSSGRRFFQIPLGSFGIELRSLEWGIGSRSPALNISVGQAWLIAFWSLFSSY